MLHAPSYPFNAFLESDRGQHAEDEDDRVGEEIFERGGVRDHDSSWQAVRQGEVALAELQLPASLRVVICD
jgi:hypothetical protein